MKKSRNHPFSLIELLIVISIISILVSLLLPVLHSAREKGIAVSCAGQLRQIGIVWGQYFNENEDCLHPALNGIGGAAWHLTMLGTKPATASTISKTLLNLNLLICPGMSKPPKSRNLDFWYVNNPHYGANILLQRYKTPKEWSASTDMYVSGRITKLSLPSRKILIADTWTQKTTTVGDINPELGRYMFNAKDYQNDGGITAARHEKSVNLLYLDGHTGSIRVPNPLDPINSAPALSGTKTTRTTYNNAIYWDWDRW